MGLLTAERETRQDLIKELINDLLTSEGKCGTRWLVKSEGVPETNVQNLPPKPARFERTPLD